MIGFAPAIRAPTTAERPTPPTPKIATLWPRLTLAVLITAPAPVMTAQPMIDVTSRGVRGSTFTTYCSSASVKFAHVKTFSDCATPSETLSVARTGSVFARDASRGTHVTSTRSPSCTWRTFEPHFSTTPVDSCPRITGDCRGRCIWCNCEWQTPEANWLDDYLGGSWIGQFDFFDTQRCLLLWQHHNACAGAHECLVLQTIDRSWPSIDRSHRSRNARAHAHATHITVVRRDLWLNPRIEVNRVVSMSERYRLVFRGEVLEGQHRRWSKQRLGAR